MKKLDKYKKFMLAIGIAALVIAVILIWQITTSDNTKDVVGDNTTNSSVEIDTGGEDDDDSSEVKEYKLSPGVVIFDENAGTLHDDGFEYEIIEGAKTPQMKIVSYYDIEREKIELPSKVTYEDKEYTVTVIGNSAFESNTVMKEVVFSDSIKKIGDNAFYSCDTLEKIVFSDSVSKIGAGAFAECLSLKNIEFGKGLKSIGNEAFCDASSLTEISIPGSVETMGKSIFYGCENMVKCTFEDGVSAVAAETFTNCYKLKEVILPESIVSIGNEAFWSCEALKELVIPSKVALCGESAFYSSGITKLSIKSTLLQPNAEMLEGCDTIKVILVPVDMADIYKDCYKDEEIQIKSL